MQLYRVLYLFRHDGLLYMGVRVLLCVPVGSMSRMYVYMYVCACV